MRVLLFLALAAHGTWTPPPDIRLTVGAWTPQPAALRDELLCFQVWRTDAIADSRRARANLLRLRLRRRRDLSDAVKTPPADADIGASAICDAVHEDHDDAPRRRGG